MRKVSTLLLMLMIGFMASAQDTVNVNTSTTVDSTAVVTQPVDANAQKGSGEFYGGGFYFGFRGMPVFSNLNFSTTNGGALKTDFVIGYGFGALVGVNFDRHWGMQVEGNYSSIAQRATLNNVTREVRLSYMQFPLMLVYNTGFDKPVNFNATVGPQIGFNTGSTSKTVDKSNSNSDSTSLVLAARPGDVGVAYGIGLDFGFGPRKLSKVSVGYRGTFGLINISKGNDNATTPDAVIIDKSHVDTYAFYLGMTFGL